MVTVWKQKQPTKYKELVPTMTETLLCDQILIVKDQFGLMQQIQRHSDINKVSECEL